MEDGWRDLPISNTSVSRTGGVCLFYDNLRLLFGVAALLFLSHCIQLCTLHTSIWSIGAYALSYCHLLQFGTLPSPTVVSGLCDSKI